MSTFARSCAISPRFIGLWLTKPFCHDIRTKRHVSQRLRGSEARAPWSWKGTVAPEWCVANCRHRRGANLRDSQTWRRLAVGSHSERPARGRVLRVRHVFITSNTPRKLRASASGRQAPGNACKPAHPCGRTRSHDLSRRSPIGGNAPERSVRHNPAAARASHVGPRFEPLRSTTRSEAPPLTLGHRPPLAPQRAPDCQTST